MSHRRDFIKTFAAVMAGGFVSSCASRGSVSGTGGDGLEKIGIQLFSIPKLAEKDFKGTVEMLAKIGYKEIEFFGPYAFSAKEDKDSWDAVTSAVGFSGSGFFGHTVQEVKQILDDNGLTTSSMHTGMASLQNAMDGLAEAADVLGAEYVILPSAPTPKDLDGYKQRAEEFNSIGEEARKRGIRFAYHNHGNGLKPINGTVPFELLMERTDPKLVFFQMDIYWMTAGGVDVSAYLDKYAQRFKLMHIKDMAREVRFSGDGGDPSQWIELFPYLANAGSGILDLETILAQAKRSGVEHFIVERDLAPNPQEDLRESFNYLSNVELKK